MKHRVIFVYLVLFFLSACGAQTAPEAWTTYHADNDTLVNPNFLSYAFEYPSYWEIEEGVNQIGFVSERKLSTDVPDKLEPGQIIVVLNINKDMPPAEMVETSTAQLESMVQFEEPLSVRLNGREAVYQNGVHREARDEVFTLAVDIGNDQRGLLSARMAEGEFAKWEEVLFKMAGSLHIEE
jgi:hypothetical protein